MFLMVGKLFRSLLYSMIDFVQNVKRQFKKIDRFPSFCDRIPGFRTDDRKHCPNCGGKTAQPVVCYGIQPKFNRFTDLQAMADFDTELDLFSFIPAEPGPRTASAAPGRRGENRRTGSCSSSASASCGR